MTEGSSSDLQRMGRIERPRALVAVVDPVASLVPVSAVVPSPPSPLLVELRLAAAVGVQSCVHEACVAAAQHQMIEAVEGEGEGEGEVGGEIGQGKVAAAVEEEWGVVDVEGSLAWNLVRMQPAVAVVA